MRCRADKHVRCHTHSLKGPFYMPLACRNRYLVDRVVFGARATPPRNQMHASTCASSNAVRCTAYGSPLFHRRRLFSATGRMRPRRSNSRRASSPGPSLRAALERTWQNPLARLVPDLSTMPLAYHAGAHVIRSAHRWVRGSRDGWGVCNSPRPRVGIDEKPDVLLGGYPGALLQGTCPWQGHAQAATACTVAAASTLRAHACMR